MNSVELLAAVLSCLLAVQFVAAAALPETQDKAYSNLASLAEPYGSYDYISPRDLQRYLSQFRDESMSGLPQKRAQTFVRFGKRSSDDDNLFRTDKRAQTFVRFGRK